MNNKFLTKFALTLLIIVNGYSAFAQTKYQKDFNGFWSDINDNYAYFEEQNIDWKKVKEIYEPQAGKISNDNEFIQLLENIFNELYNGHSSLSTNLKTSNRLIPSGSDLYIEKSGNRYLIKDLRKGFGADLAGLKIGMEVTLFNGKPIDEQLKKFLPKFADQYNQKMYQYAIDMLFAGTHDSNREIVATENGKPTTFHPVSYGNRNELFYSKVLNESTAYIKINNSLGSNNLITAFDQAFDSLFQYKNLIIDLTETPSGGNSTVARAIMGRFTDKLLPFQVHEFDEREY
ncbi:S41 family peptidase [Pedobacter sp. P26]|uniref:S41 family peptidase n=1 Tax=Pedobacter sp. P26 TaxID=3423956 RepID=UPI003D66C97F